ARRHRARLSRAHCLRLDLGRQARPDICAAIDRRGWQDRARRAEITWSGVMPRAASATIPTSLSGASWLARPETHAVLTALTAAGHEARIVGGAVRNALLGEPVTDIDIATTATPDEIMAAASAAGLQAIPTGVSHGTVTIIANR